MILSFKTGSRAPLHSVLLGGAFGLLLGTLPGQDGAAPRIELRAKKGDVLGYTVRRSSANEGSSQRGDFKTSQTSEIQYRIEVAEAKDGGSAVLRVSYESVKARSEGGESSWEFDSAGKEGGSDQKGGDAASVRVRESISKPVTVTIAGGKVTDIQGFPEVSRPAPGEEGGRARGFRAAAVAGRTALERDLEWILAAPVAGQTLEKGKEYRAERAPPRPADGEREGAARRRQFGQRDANLVFKFEGPEKAAGADAAKFSLSAAPPAAPAPPAEGGKARRRRAGTPRAEGTALVSLTDGALLKLEATIEEKSSAEGQDGQGGLRFSRQQKISIERRAARPASVSL